MIMCRSQGWLAHALCARALKKGKVIVYPTDTIYGLGVDTAHTAAVLRVRTIKGRDCDKPILALVADLSMLREYAQMTPLAEALAEAFLPGPLTLVLTTKDERLRPIANADGSAGFRFPNNPFGCALARALGGPITSTSVNRSGEAPAADVREALRSLGAERSLISVCVDSGPAQRTTPSTIVDARGDRAVVLRDGAVTRSMLARFL